MDALFESAFERTVQLYFDFRSWLVAHLENRPFAVCVQTSFLALQQAEREVNVTG